MADKGASGAGNPCAILLDLDGTILDDGSEAERIWCDVCEEAAQNVPGVDGDLIFGEIDRTRRWFWSDAERHRRGRLDLLAATRWFVGESLTSLGLNLPDLAIWIADTYRERREAAVRPFPGAVETLERARGYGVRLALITNGAARPQRAKLERFGLERHFDYVLIEGEFGRGKPDPEVYQAAMEALQSQPDTTWMVGDNLQWEVAVPQRLGLFTVWVDESGAGLPEGADVSPDRIIRSLRELL